MEFVSAFVFNATIEKTKTRFVNYGEVGFFCGKDGFLYLIVDGNFEYFGEFVVLGLGFFYVVGWIGYAGRFYV